MASSNLSRNGLEKIIFSHIGLENIHVKVLSLNGDFNHNVCAQLQYGFEQCIIHIHKGTRNSAIRSQTDGLMADQLKTCLEHQQCRSVYLKNAENNSKMNTHVLYAGSKH